MSAADEVAQQLRTLREDYSRQLPIKLALLEQAFHKHETEEGALQTLRFLAHGLAGSGSTFGFPRLSGVAQQLEILVDRALEEERPLHVTESEAAADLIVMLHQIANGPATPLELPRVSRMLAPGVPRKLVYLVEDDAGVARELALQLGHFGFQVAVFENPQKLANAKIDPTLAAVIMDIVFPQGDLAGTEAIKELTSAAVLKAPVIFTSVRSDLHARLAAVKAGAACYITKPTDIRSLVTILDSVTSSQPPEPYRVLIVDDTEPLAHHHAVTLQSAGIFTDIVTDPMKLLSHLMDFRPDLVLMDMYMPGCTGAELAAVIRQFEDYISVPIVFLSTERDLDKQLTAMQIGGDDFLTKPIEPAHLIAAISSRLRRYRILRSHMDQDSLTGLLNHGAVRKHLSLEVARAARQNDFFCFVMIDLDHFKSVNDTYGHPAGDRVLQCLAELLKKRLRKSDVIGRVGGEEFAIILPHTKGADAVTVLNAIRESFSGVRQYADGKEFTVTFSCGVGEYRKGENTESIYAWADQALYQAKQAGRNQIVIFG
ncbi:MAG TPA: diguanylate cyclase [Burkholderiales bacterium]|jgi:diguanylate cyclase (GGDEF)-like protein|nr:diguanylate cyclase [Burkholderiales bacterium]